MGAVSLNEINVTPLKHISTLGGDVKHAMKRTDPQYMGFGEAYFSTINNGEIKGWNKHKSMILNLVVPMGAVTFVIYDDREESISNGRFFGVKLSPSNYQRLTVPPGLWIAFKGNNSKI